MRTLRARYEKLYILVAMWSIYACAFSKEAALPDADFEVSH